MMTTLLLAAGFADALDHLHNARDHAVRVRDAAIDPSGWTGQVGEDALAAVAAARDTIRDADIGDETRVEMLRQLDSMENEIRRAIEQIRNAGWAETPVPFEHTTIPRQPLPPESPAPTSLTLEELRGFRDEIVAAMDRVAPFSWNAAAELDRRMGDLEHARGYAGNWGGWIYVATLNTVNRHGAWQHAVDQLILEVERGRPIEPGYSDRFRREMARWRSEAEYVQVYCEEMMRQMEFKGIATDRVLASQEERWAYRISPEDCARECEGPYERIALAEEAYAAAAARVADPNLLWAPIAYEVWLSMRPAEPTPAPTPERTESDRFRDEAARLARSIEDIRARGGSLIEEAQTFDSDYFNHVWDLYDFRGTRMIGGEVNYYFQGMIWRRAGVPQWLMERIIDGWNASNGSLIGNGNQYAAASAGWADMDRAMAHPDGPVAFFESDAYTPPAIVHVGPNPERVVPGLNNRGAWRWMQPALDPLFGAIRWAFGLVR